MKWTVPNMLTVFRLLAAPAVPVMFLYFSRPFADAFALIVFLLAAVTDWLDGYLARAWQQGTKVGAMLDPIADKAMVVIALMVIAAYSSYSPWLILPATVILFREVFVSGLREYLGDVAGTLKVTNLAKWKTTFQMVAVAALFSQGIFDHSTSDAGVVPRLQGGAATFFEIGRDWSGRIGLVLLWFAAGLTLITGWDYFRKSLPHLKDER